LRDPWFTKFSGKLEVEQPLMRKVLANMQNFRVVIDEYASHNKNFKRPRSVTS
jgi:hypothetical protein